MALLDVSSRIPGFFLLTPILGSVLQIWTPTPPVGAEPISEFKTDV
jgi:hypothetical protein